MSTRKESAPALFVITIDTEADDAWTQPERITMRNLAEVPRFQALCERYGVMPTYLITYECAERDEAISVLKPVADAGQCEIGHHLHCWTTPPFERRGADGIDLEWLGAYQFELPDALFAEKAACLSEKIAAVYGRAPTSHRAGRWGIDQRSVDWLIANGYIVETSVTPLQSWADSMGRSRGGPSFFSAPRNPYAWHAGRNGAARGHLLEIPLTVDVPGDLVARHCARYLQSGLPGASVVERLFTRVGGGMMLRPDPDYPGNALQDIVDRSLAQGAQVLNLMIHSSELAPGCSPFSSTRERCAQVWTRLENVFAHLQRRGVACATLSGAAARLTPSAA